jgi:uncharacterized membrane protein (UPF0182 family)
MRARLLPLLITALVVFLALPSLVEFYTDWLWFGELGYQHVFLRVLSARSWIILAVFVVVVGFFLVNLVVAFRSLRRREFVVVTAHGPRVVVVDPQRLRTLATALTALGALIIGFYAGSQWDIWLFYWNAVPFGKADPILGRDASFYVFTLPFYEFLRSLALATLIPTLIAMLVLYIGSGAMGLSPQGGRRGRGGIFITSRPQRHLALLLAMFFLILAAGAWLEVPNLLTSASGILHGASYTDVHARIPALRVLTVISLLGAGLAVYQAFQPRFWPILFAAGAYFAVSFAGSAYAGFIQRFSVAPNEQAMETPFIGYNIAATRDAFGLADAQEREISGDAVLARADIDKNTITLRNVPLWDHQPLLDTFAQIQEIRTYYDFTSVDNDRYTINGDYRQIMLSARELNSESLQNRNWINEHLTFTHGYGLTLGPVNQVTPEGLPTLFIKNLPPESSVDLKIDEPSLYFGELANDYVIVRTRNKEFHYPKGDANVFTTYEGRGGVDIGSLWHKLLFSIQFKSFKILLSNDITAESRILFHRQIDERVRTIAPFLIYDPDPYLAIDNGRLLWVQDAYTTSDRYPYATPGGRVNYIRNSIKVVIDAYHGTTTFYRIDAQDPIAATLDRAFPGLLQPFSAMPEGLRARLRYPRMIFAMQAQMFSTYHMNNPAVFYNKEDQWEVPTIGDAGTPRMEPYYSIMRLPGESKAEFIQMLPFTPRQKDNLAAWMVARSDGDGYGRLLVFQFPKQKVVFGPRQVIARINQDQTISPQITLWNQQGSQVIQGTLLVIPVEESVLYVRALYLRASGSGAGRSIPELKRVIVVYENQIVMADTLEAAIDRIFPKVGGRPPAPETTTGAAAAEATEVEPTKPAAGGAGTASDIAALAAEARAHYDRAIKAQREGNWALYGEEIKKLGELLEQMKAKRSEGSSRPR